MTNITISQEIIENIIKSISTTFIYAYLGLGYGVILAMLLTYFSVKFRRFKIGKVFSLLLNSLHELIIVLLLSIIWGLNSFIAIISIAICFGGVMSRVFTSNIDNLADDNFINYKNKGFSFATNMLFNVFPKSFKINSDYIAYRFECALRSSIVLSYIGIVGLGFYINLALNDSNYSLVFTYVYSLIIFMLLTSFVVNKLKNIINKNIFKSTILYLMSIALLTLIYVLNNYNDFLNLFYNARFELISNSLTRVFTLTSSIYNTEFLNEIIKYTLQTIRMGFISIAILMILTNIHMYLLILYSRNNSKVLQSISNFINVVLRSIPELVLLSILLFIFKPNIFSGALAISLHNFGIVSKLINNRFSDNKLQIRLAYNKNYSNLTILLYVLYPILRKYLLSTYIYRYEIAIKSSIVVGLLGSGGLGYLFRLKLSSFNYDAMIFICIVYVILFTINDLIYTIIKNRE